MGKATQVIKNYFIKPLLWLVAILLLLLLALIVAVRSPKIQNWMVYKATTYLSSITKHEVKVGNVNIAWLDELLLEDVSVYDRQKNEMIKVGSLRADFDLLSLISSPEPVISEVWLDHPQVSTIVLVDSKRLNINELIDAFRNLSTAKTDTSSAITIFHIDKVHVNEGTYSYIDLTEDSIPNQFDYYHFTLAHIKAEVDQMRIAGDTFEINVNNLSCIDTKTKLDVKRMDVFYRYTSQSMQFHYLNAHIGKSVVKDYLEFGYESNDDLSHFNTKVNLKVNLDSSVVYAEDLAHFAPSLKGLKERYAVSTKAEGRVVDLSCKNVILHYGKSSYIKGRVSFKGFPNLDETFVNARFEKFTSNSSDLGQYVGDYLKGILSKFGRINYTGTYIGFFSDFVAKGSFETPLGKLVSDINIKLKEDEKHSEYNGKLKTTNFQLGKLMGQESFIGTIDMKGTIKGKGFSYSSAHFDLDANINRLGINQYDYKNITVQANLKKETFMGKIVSKDSNATFTLNGLLDFNKTPHFLDFSADVSHVNFKNIKVTNDLIFLSTRANLNIVGNNLDDFQGDASFSHTLVSNGKNQISLDTLKVITEKVDQDRYLNLFSDIVEVNIDGDFSYGELSKDVPRLFNEYLLVLENKEKEVTAYYEKAEPYQSKDYRLNYNVLIKKANPVIGLFLDKLTISDNSRFGGTFEKMDNKANFSVIGFSNRFQYGNFKFFNSKINYSSSKSLNHPFVDASGIFYSQKQQFTDAFKTDGLNMQLIWNNEKLLFDASLLQTKEGNSLGVKGDVTLREGYKEFYLSKTDLKILKTAWHGDSSIVILGPKDIEVKHFGLRNEDQSLTAEGIIAKSSDQSFKVEVDNFDVKPFGVFLGKELDGSIDGNFDFTNLLSNNFKVDFDGGVKDLKIDRFLIGTILGQTDWSSEKEQFDVDFTLSRDSIPNMNITGFVKPYENNRLVLEAKLDNFKLTSFEPFIKDYFSRIGGNCSGTLKIGGTLLRPNLTGAVKVDEGQFQFNFLKTTYNFSNTLVFDTSAIRFNETVLTDTIGNRCILNGAVTHNRFRNFSFNIKGHFKNLLLLNTTEQDNKLFYGKAFGTGFMSISGPLNTIDVYVNARNDEDSKLFIPINTAESLGGNVFVTFVQKKAAVQKNSDEEETEAPEESEPFVTRVTMDMDLNPNMDFELILDKQTGDIIKGNGYGNLKFKASTEGDFNLYGKYTFKKGLYNFTMLNLVNKKFDIVDGSLITWNGDPFGGMLDIKATIEQKASLRDILAETDTAWYSHPSIRKGYPAIVNLFLKGNLLHPEINYKIQIKDYPFTITDARGRTLPLDNYVRAFLQQLEVNEQQLNRQVFSLLVLRKFFPLSSVASGGLAGQGAAGTVSSLLSSQLSSWISQVDENLQIDIDLNGFNEQALNDLRLRLTYVPDLFDKRIRITRDGSFTNNQNKATANSIAGDWSLEYMITRDGMLRLRMFTKNNYNNLATTLNGTNQMSTGFSFMHTQSFDNLSELIKRKRNREQGIKEDNNLEPVAEPGAGLPIDSTTDVLRKKETKNK